MAREQAEHFCPWKPNAACATPSTAASMIGVGVDDDRVFAAHFEDGALDPDLAWLLRRGALVDVQTDFARSGERDVARLRMRNDGVAETCAAAGAEVHHALGQAGFFEQLEELRGDRRRIARRLQDNGVAADDRGHRHPGHDGAGEIPRRNHGADAERNVDAGVSRSPGSWIGVSAFAKRSASRA